MTKIAFPTEDGKTISQHFGRAPFFTVASIQNDGGIGFEERPKWLHGLQESEPHNHAHSHQSMFDTIADCQVLVVGGMGEPAYQAAVEAGLQVILTGERDIPVALQALRTGSLLSDERRVHTHRQNH